MAAGGGAEDLQTQSEATAATLVAAAGASLPSIQGRGQRRRGRPRRRTYRQGLSNRRPEEAEEEEGRRCVLRRERTQVCGAASGE